MTTRIASCSCGQLRLTCQGEPGRVSMCHCLECQKRTGSVFATQARFSRDGVSITGSTSTWARQGDSGGTATFHFCPTCGSTVYWEMDWAPDSLAIAVGAFADPTFPPPTVMVYEDRMHPWALSAEGLGMERWG
ncbi:GFA family protein [Niveispirillum cyanobacteriorum]|uniref:Aldehyde-activating protein n=1 Tax=Niveispirillum cyanobacteriorum TaxID=1612173 RepID=A0A2K9N8I9_9PROT|nr:GFA family protein [Niveispirillum cyanobacteriorum]AUN29460.1 aldehyde-activating protein [Niveispirillum cyanobacteriorum]